MNWILNLDREVFFLINKLPHSEILNTLALTLSGVGNYGWILYAFGLVLFIKEEKKDHRFGLALISAGGFAWLGQFFLKQIFTRVRPYILPGIMLVGNIPEGYSFPSGHAMTAWALAEVLVAKEPRGCLVIYSLAVLISLSRIYLGVHYPLDVMVGGIIGILIGKIIIKIGK